jgi:aryl-alcohol dehydrogenase-like predicted oxidoreductase
MKKRILGRSGLEVFPLALGGNVFGWTVDGPTAFRILDAFTDAGGNLLDTADSYSRWVPGNIGGESEIMIGKWLKKSGKRNKVVVATKVGSLMGPGRKGLSKEYIVQAVEDSLKRLQTEYIDLYQSHFDDPETPLEETMEAYASLMKQGKVKAIGASNFTADRLSEALHMSEQRGYPSYQSLQPRYNLYDREDYERSLEPLCREAGLGVITYYSLASGFLSGKYRSTDDLSRSARGQNAGHYLTTRGFRILEALDRVADRYHVQPASVALAWLIARPGITAPIASVTNLPQLDEMLRAATLELEASSLDILNKASDWHEASETGTRAA